MIHSLADLSDWLDDQTRPGVFWYAKRLSANDTLATNAHQAGPYIPRSVLFEGLPDLEKPEEINPRVSFELAIDSHMDCREVTAIWYNNKITGGGTRNEARITNFGGISSPLLHPDSTGSLVLFAFSKPQATAKPRCSVWLCDHETEEVLIEDRIGAIDPGQWRTWSLDEADLFQQKTVRSDCYLQENEIPSDWLQAFPTGADIIRKAIEIRDDSSFDVDTRLIKRRKCEFEIFKSIEEAAELPEIRKGFKDMAGFLSRAQSILQRRKSRSGRSLELHIREIFLEEQLSENQQFAHGAKIEGNKRPDFLFPSVACYENPSFPTSQLRMLGVKTTCKDRWRQILNEAERIPEKHLFTLQEGVSENQFKEMAEAGIQLVVPKSLHEKYPSSIRPHLQEFESFLGTVRTLTN